MDHALTGEVDLELAHLDDVAGTLATWFDDTLALLAPAERNAIENGPKLPAEAVRKPMPCGPPRAVWGFVSVGHFGNQSKGRVYTAKNLEWMLKQLHETPERATLALTRLDSEGYPDAPIIRIEFRRYEYCPEWARFFVTIPCSRLAEPQRQDAFLGVLRKLAAAADPFYGQVGGHEDALGRTELELGLRAAVHPSTYSPVRREYLRGYAWLTIVPRELADRLGGVDGLKATGAFAEVERLPNGGLWLQATSAYADYDMAAATAVWRAVAPALRPGTPERPEREQPVYLVLEDAAMVRAAPSQTTYV